MVIAQQNVSALMVKRRAISFPSERSNLPSGRGKQAYSASGQALNRQNIEGLVLIQRPGRAAHIDFHRQQADAGEGVRQCLLFRKHLR